MLKHVVPSSCCCRPAPVSPAGGLVMSRPGRPAVHAVLSAPCPRRPSAGAHPAAGGFGQPAAGPHHQSGHGQWDAMCPKGWNGTFLLPRCNSQKKDTFLMFRSFLPTERKDRLIALHPRRFPLPCTWGITPNTPKVKPKLFLATQVKLKCLKDERVLIFYRYIGGRRPRCSSSPTETQPIFQPVCPTIAVWLYLWYAG